MKIEKRSKLVIGATLASVILIAAAAGALIAGQRAGDLAERTRKTDAELNAIVAELARMQSEQFGFAQQILALHDHTDDTSQQRRAQSLQLVEQLSAKIGEMSSQGGEVAHAASDQDESYTSLVELLMKTGVQNQEFVETIQTLERLSREGRRAEAERFAEAIQAQCDVMPARALGVVESLHARSIQRVVESRDRQLQASWQFLGFTVAAFVLWVIYFRLRLRQTRIALARSRAVKAPRAEHLNVARAQDGRGDDQYALEQNGKPLAGCRVLAAEDGPHNRRYIERVLANAGVDVTFAENGEDATNLIFAANKAGEPYDVVLMDMQMPVLDGFEATKTLRRFHHQGPVVAVSANSQRNDREKCLDIGCDAYLTKPISRDELYAAVAKFYLESSAKPGAESCQARVD